MKETEFINELMCHIIEGTKIPKVQVERAITPILSFFIERIMNKLFESSNEFSGEYQLISPEFPLKKENNQSTNIDFLLVNVFKKVLVLFELKTDIGSISNEQLEIYLKYKESISNSSASTVRDDLIQISKASKGSKYENILKNFDVVIPKPSEIQKAIVIYLVPNATTINLKENAKPDYIFGFQDLPVIIDHKFGEFWTIIRNNLVRLDAVLEKKVYSKLPVEDRIAAIVSNIKLYVFRVRTGIKPVSFQYGILGGGLNPNYQVKFSDGSIKTFRFNGTPHHFPIFHDKNLSHEILWENFEDLV